MPSKETLNTNEYISKRMVVKIGSSSISRGGNPLNKEFVGNIAKQASTLFRARVEIALVSSGSVVSGKRILDLSEDDVLQDQIAAIYGQNYLMDIWNEEFKPFNIPVGQVLFSEEDLQKPNTPILFGMKHGIQIINANDATNDVEMKAFLKSADNDKLAGHVAKFVKADTLLLLTDTDGVIDSNGNVIQEMKQGTEVSLLGKSGVGTGGMISKVDVAFDCTRAGIRTVIANASEKDVILNLAQGKKIGTLFVE